MRTIMLSIGHYVAYGMAFCAGAIFLMIAWQMALDHIPGFKGLVNRFFRWKDLTFRTIRRIRLIKEDVHAITLFVMGYGFYLLMWALYNHGLTRY